MPSLTSISQESSQATEESLFADVDQYEHDIASTASGDPVKDWLDVLPMACSDPIQYWTSLLGRHPLAQMALDILSAPAASTDVERAFSRGGLTVSKHRHNLSEKSVHAATVLGSWAQAGGIIPEEEILEALKNKSRRTKPSTTANVFEDDDDVQIIE